MTVEIISGDEHITAVLCGELDHHTASAARELMDARLERCTPRLCIFDMAGISFMDSSGIGLLLGRQRVMDAYGGKVRVKNPSRHAEKIIRLAGLQSMIIPEKCKV